MDLLHAALGRCRLPAGRVDPGLRPRLHANDPEATAPTPCIARGYTAYQSVRSTAGSTVACALWDLAGYVAQLGA